MAGDVTGSCLRLLDHREMPPSKGGRFCNLNDWQHVSGVAMVVTWSGRNAKAF